MGSKQPQPAPADYKGPTVDKPHVLPLPVDSLERIKMEARVSQLTQREDAELTAQRLTEGLCTSLAKQVGGGHYKSLAIQPVEYCHKNNMGCCEFSAIKYVTRWREKGGIEDLKKAIHFIEMLIEMETKDEQSK